MVTVKEATEIIFNHLFDPGVIRVRLAEVRGMVLAEAISADRDFPPFDRVAMDGIAIDHGQWLKGMRTFQVEGTQAAGQPRQSLQHAEHCMEVMTGAILPSGCNAVIRYEDVNLSGQQATVRLASVMPFQNIHRQAADARKGDVLLEAGTRVSPAEVALLASVGKQEVEVFAFPKVAIISTGDELVDVGVVPAAHQIRRSNTYALQAALSGLGASASVFHLPDDRSEMEQELNDLVARHEVLILSGGVSKGKFDFVPEVMEKAGIHKVFHQVSQKPGKPFWFGSSRSGKIAFALPGNPVSTFMCFYKYVRPWILKSLRQNVEEASAMLASDFSFSQPLTYFLQVSVKNEGGRLVARPVPGAGSGDFANLKNVDGFLELPLEKSDFKAGEVYSYIPFRD
ncbi:MAG TPA: molybdopterin molybdotransferase MoeA [Chryseosolibacter sp.]